MDITFTGHQLEITPALKNFTREKFEKLIHHFNRINSIKVTFNIEKLTHIAEATIHVPREPIHARSESTNDMYAAIDGLVDKLDRQIKRYKEKETNHKL